MTAMALGVICKWEGETPLRAKQALFFFGGVDSGLGVRG